MSAHGVVLASAGYDHAVRFWDVSGSAVVPAGLSGSANVPQSVIQGAGVLQGAIQGAGVPQSVIQGAGVPHSAFQGAGVPHSGFQGANVPPSVIQGAGVPPSATQGANVPSNAAIGHALAERGGGEHAPGNAQNRGRQLGAMQHNESHVNALALSADKRMLAVAGCPAVRVYDVARALYYARGGGGSSASEDAHCAPLHVLETGAGNAVAAGFFSSGRRLWTANEDGCVRVWDLVQRLQRPDAAPERELAVLGAGARGLQLAVLLPRAPLVTCAALAADERSLAVGDDTGRVRIWDLLPAAVSSPHHGRAHGHASVHAASPPSSPHHGRTHGHAPGEHGAHLVSERVAVEFVPAVLGSVAPLPGGPSAVGGAWPAALPVRGVAVSRDGMYCAAVDDGGSVHVFGLSADERHASPTLASGQDIYSGGGAEDSGRAGERTPAGSVPARPQACSEAAHPGARALSCVFGPASASCPDVQHVLLTTGSDGMARLWAVVPRYSIADGAQASSHPHGAAEALPREHAVPVRLELLRVLQGHAAGCWVWDASFSADGAFAVTAASDGCVRLWDCATGAPVSVFCGHSKAVLAVALNDQP